MLWPLGQHPAEEFTATFQKEVMGLFPVQNHFATPTLSCLMVTQQLKEPFPNLTMLKCYRTMRTLPAFEV